MSLQIPQVTLAVSHEGCRLFPKENGGKREDEGYLGELASGSLEVKTIVAPGALVYGIRRWGDDAYDLQRDRGRLSGLENGEKVYTAKVGLEANYETCEPFVPYPNNLLLLAELLTENSCLTNRVRIWRVAVVSQEGRFFLTVQQGYNTTAHRDGRGQTVFPRLRAHPQLEAILARLRPNADGMIMFPRAPLPDEKRPRRELVQTDHVSEVAGLPPVSAFVPEPEPTRMNLRKHEAHVLRFYDARGIGTLLTPHGVARFSWRDCPTRPQRKYLMAGEHVRYERLGKPVLHSPNLRFEDDKRRPGRQTKFTFQAFNLTLCA